MPAAGYSLRQWLQQATGSLAAVSATPDIEARHCLCHVLQVNNSYLYTWPEKKLTAEQLAALDNIIRRRLAAEPLAYILGSWWFWGLQLLVSGSTLIPRPDTECLVEKALSLPLPDNASVLDLGTGTGAIALALASSRPRWQLTAVDKIEAAVALAQANAARLQLPNCQIKQSDWFTALAGERFHLIVSNPPYIDATDPHLQALQHEPLSALVAADEGLADLRLLCRHAGQFLLNGGWLWLEHGYNQAEAVQGLLKEAGFKQVQSERDYGGNWRITGGCFQH